MGNSSSITRPQELVEFRKANTTVENMDIPARAENRSVTDKKGFILFGVALLILLPLLIYTLLGADLRHFTHGVDNCGNFCGEINEHVDGVSCSGKDHKSVPFSDDGNCVSKCRFQHWNGRCIEQMLPARRSESEIEIWEPGNVWWKFLLTILITIALSVLTLVFLRFAPAPMVWGTIILSMAVLVILTGGLWYLYISRDESEIESKDNAMVFLGLTVLWTIIAAIIIVVFIVLFQKIGLVVQLYREAAKTLAAMPFLVLLPILANIITIIVYAFAVLVTFYMSLSEELYEVSEDIYIYALSGVKVFALLLNIFVAIWALRFIADVHYMIVSGSVSQWFFTRNKDDLRFPICTSMKLTFKYHLGTVFFGSLLITLFAVVKAILRSLCRNACCRCLFVMCCSSVEVILKFFSENAYIETGLHGQSFLRSAKRATKLLLANASSVIAINCVGDFVLFVLVLFLAIISTAISYALFLDLKAEGLLIATVLCLIINLIIIGTIFGVFQNIIDTLLICFCEDSIINDGISRPYYMSRGLMQFVENAKKIYGKNGQ